MKKITVLLAIGALGLAACGSSNYNSSSSSTSKSSTTASSSGGGYGSGGSSTASNASTSSSSKSLQIEMYDNYFGTKTITGKPGSTVKVKLKNEGKAAHNFKIDGQSAANADVDPGKTGTATVKIPASGSVQFYCEYHKGLGMVGTVRAS